jgi:hypothetical protein
MAASVFAIFTPSILLMIAPTGIPALSAPSLGLKRAIRAPIPVKVLSKKTPSTGRVDLPVAMISSMTRFASLIGIEKPSPMFPPTPPDERVAIAS